MEYAKRDTKITHIAGGAQPDALWRDILNPQLLPETEIQATFAKLCKTDTTTTTV